MIDDDEDDDYDDEDDDGDDGGDYDCVHDVWVIPVYEYQRFE